jgi:hypothetical protein
MDATTTKPPFGEGDRVRVLGKHGYPALVLDVQHDRYGWDVSILPERGGEPRWVGSTQLELIRKADER